MIRPFATRIARLPAQSGVYYIVGRKPRC
jgi:hypothetical protein